MATRTRSSMASIPPPLEKDVSGAIKGYLTIRGWFVSTIKERYYTNGQRGAYSEPGIPDLMAIKNGRVVMLEVKRPKVSYAKKARASQDEWHAKWRAQGGEVYVVHGVEDAAEVCDKEHKDETFF